MPWLILLLFLGLSRAQAGPQLVLKDADSAQRRNISNANRIFYQAHAPMKSFWQAEVQAGHAVLPGTLRKGVRLYHSGPTANGPPKGLQWLAFEPEHANYFIYVSKHPNSKYTMWTYDIKRDLDVLIFDGQSSSKTLRGGTRDLQQVLIDGEVCDKPDGRLCDDDPLAEKLCKLTTTLGYDGIVRQSGVFEYINCDFSDATAYDIVQSVNAFARFEPPTDKTPAQFDLPNDNYTRNTFGSLYQSVAQHAEGDRRVVPHPQHMVTLYDEADYPSLAEDNNKLPINKHRLFDMSHEDAATLRAELKQAAQDRLARRSSGWDWSAVTATVINRYGMRLAELLAITSNKTAVETDEMSVVHRVILATHSVVFPYIDAPIVLETWPKASPGPAVVASLQDSKKLCRSVYTPSSIEKLNKQEQRIKLAIEGVLDRICDDVIDVFAHALLSERGGSLQKGAINTWKELVEDLMAWLNWATWKRPDRQCSFSAQEFPYVKSWPSSLNSSLTPFDDIPPPACVRKNDLVWWLPDQYHSTE